MNNKLNLIINPKRDKNWIKYSTSSSNGDGHGKFCYFLSCKKSKLPIRDIFSEHDKEPNYETKTYNYFASCNQHDIRNAYKRGIKYIIFITRYLGKINKFKNKCFITGLFPISAYIKIENRTAFKSNNPTFLSIEDSLELDGKIWHRWFKEPFPSNLRYMNKLTKEGTISMKEILNHFQKNKNSNILIDYIEEIERLKKIF